MTETALIGPTLVALSAIPGVRVARMNTGAFRIGDRYIRFGVPGLADICGIIRPSGRLLCVEMKAARGRQSRQQRLFQRAIERHGGLYVVARSPEEAVKFTRDAIVASKSRP